jgi:hypothetical protein
MKICLEVVKTLVFKHHPRVNKILKDEALRQIVFMWTAVGDSISMIYTGTPSTLASVCMKGEEDFSEQMGRYYKSTHRFVQNTYKDSHK